MPLTIASRARRLAGALLAAITLAGCAAPLRMANVPAPDTPGFSQTIAAVSSSMVARGQVTGFWYEPAEIYAARLEAIRQARRSIHFETFFMTPGARVEAFADALIERAKAGVKVRFIADHSGTAGLAPAYWARLRQAGVEVRFYHPFEWTRFWLYNTRTHRKALLIDGKVGFTGGTGVSDHWDGKVDAGPTPPWCDVEVRLEGPVVGTLEGIFAQHWAYLGGEADLGPEVFRWEPDEGEPILVTPSSPTDGDSPVRALYYASMRAARKRIWIASPYFLPSKAASQALIEAHKRGVDVRILSVGPQNDRPQIYRAVQEHAADLVRAGVPIYEYQPSMMHAKALLIDDHWVVTGSANFDPRSFFHNDELTVALNDPQLGEQVETFFEKMFAASLPFDRAAWDARDPWSRTQGRATLVLWWFL